MTIQQAIALAPGVPDFHSNLGAPFRALGQLDEAIVAHCQAIALKPNYPEALSNKSTHALWSLLFSKTVFPPSPRAIT